MGSQNAALQAYQANAQAGALIRANAVEMTQSIASATITNPTPGLVINVPPRNVGLAKYFILELAVNITNASGAGLTLTDFGPANLLSQLIFTDLQNNTRIQTTGWHLDVVATVKSRRPYGSAYINTTGIDSPVNYGSHWNVIEAPATIAASASATVYMKYLIPLAYSDNDYRGAVYLNVVNATANLQFTLNPNVFIASGDSTLAVYTGNAGATITSLSYNVYQVYMDQLPQGPQGAILPQQDLGTSYELKNIANSAIVAGQDFPVQYSNFRSFMSTTMIYYNGSARVSGADVAYWELLAANFTPIWKIGPNFSALKTRQIIGCDMPPGCYYFSSRLKPILTTQYGNMQLVLNASTAGAGSYLLTGYEDFAQINSVTGAGSLAAS